MSPVNPNHLQASYQKSASTHTQAIFVGQLHDFLKASDKFFADLKRCEEIRKACDSGRRQV